MEWKDASKELPPISKDDTWITVLVWSSHYRETIGIYNHHMGHWEILVARGWIQSDVTHWALIEGPKD